jgi:hypothetical protein
MRIVLTLLCCVALFMSSRPAFAQDAPPAPPAEQRGFPGVKIDAAAKKVVVDCQTLDITAPLEFLAVVSGTNEHESILRSPIKPSHLHAALLAIGLEPGEPVKYSEAAKKWLPPKGPPLHLTIEFDKDGTHQVYPAYRLMRDVKTKKEMPRTTWIFTGSRLLEDNTYAADATGYLVSVVNFDLTVIDTPQLASSANETLEWEINADLMPARGTKATLTIEPAGKVESPGPGVPPAVPPTVTTVAPATQSTAKLSDVAIDVAKLDSLQAVWDAAVKPHGAALTEAAQAHYDVINAMRKEQQRLVDEADRIQRKIDDLEKQYQNMTTPHPPATGQ